MWSSLDYFKGVSTFTEALDDSDEVISGTVEAGAQYPMHMETQTCLAEPQEGHYVLHAATQVMGPMQHSVAAMLDIGTNE